MAWQHVASRNSIQRLDDMARRSYAAKAARRFQDASSYGGAPGRHRGATLHARKTSAAALVPCVKPGQYEGGEQGGG